MSEDADKPSSLGGLVGKLKGLLTKAVGAVKGLVKKKDDAGAGATGVKATGKPTERSKKMKDAVEAARKNKDDDD